MSAIDNLREVVARAVRDLIDDTWARATGAEVARAVVNLPEVRVLLVSTALLDHVPLEIAAAEQRGRREALAEAAHQVVQHHMPRLTPDDVALWLRARALAAVTPTTSEENQ